MIDTDRTVVPDAAHRKRRLANPARKPSVGKIENRRTAPGGYVQRQRNRQHLRPYSVHHSAYGATRGASSLNPVHGVRRPKYNVNRRRLSEQEYRALGDILRRAVEDGQYATAAEMVRLIALTGCRRSEIIKLRWCEIDSEGSCLRLTDSKEGASVRPIGLAALECLEDRREEDVKGYVFQGWTDDTPFGAFPSHWAKIFGKTKLADITPHVLRHSFASIANDLGFTEATIAALVGHSRGTITSRYIHSVDTSLIMAADNIAGYIQGLLDGTTFQHPSYVLDRESRKASLAHFLGRADSAADKSDRVVV